MNNIALTLIAIYAIESKKPWTCIMAILFLLGIIAHGVGGSN